MVEISVVLERIAERPVLFFILAPLMISGVSFMLMGFLQKYSKNTWFCEKMGWHLKPHPSSVSFDGCSQHGSCPRCKAEIMQDGQGNWF